MKSRCEWATDPLNADYHDKEWGNPVHDDNIFFEFITLEGAQAGLTWLTVLKRRESYRKAFANFNPVKVCKFTDKHVSKLMQNPGIIRHELKIRSTIKNAKAFLKIQKEFGSFDNYIWQFVDGKPLNNKRKSLKDIPSTSPESDRLSKDLKRRGFSFVGSTICYALMQACGLVNDHTAKCYKKL